MTSPRALAAPSSLKGVLSARDAAAALAEGFRAEGVECDERPVADGGEGTIDALDGDSKADTPPDPGPAAYNAHNQNICTSPALKVTGTTNGQQVSYTFQPDRTNVMGYYTSQQCNAGSSPPPQTFTFDQIQQMQRTLSKAPRNALWP